MAAGADFWNIQTGWLKSGTCYFVCFSERWHAVFVKLTIVQEKQQIHDEQELEAEAVVAASKAFKIVSKTVSR